MKKILGVLSIVLVLGLVSTFAFAETTTPTKSTTQPSGVSIEEKEAWFKEKIESKKEQINEALKEGTITKEKAKIWNDHFSDKEKFHKENGFMPACNGLGNRNHHGGKGGRMMRGNRG